MESTRIGANLAGDTRHSSPIRRPRFSWCVEGERCHSDHYYFGRNPGSGLDVHPRTNAGSKISQTTPCFTSVAKIRKDNKQRNTFPPLKKRADFRKPGTASSFRTSQTDAFFRNYCAQSLVLWRSTTLCRCARFRPHPFYGHSLANVVMKVTSQKSAFHRCL